MSDCECPKPDEGIPAWVMTFADLMSLLLAFFVLLFSFSEMDKNVYKELAGSLKDAFGVQREIKVRETPRGINIIAREFSPGRPKPTVHNEVRQMTTDEAKMYAVFTDAAKEGQENQNKKSDNLDDKSFNAMKENADDEVAEKDEAVKAETVKEEIVKAETVKADELKANDSATEVATDVQTENAESTANATLSEKDLAMMARIEKDSELLRESLEEELYDGLIDMEVKDKRIVLLIREKGSFVSGSAQMIEPFKVVVEKISEVFGEFQGVVVVSGHTDNIPIHTYRFRSNWELSSSRAVSVIHELMKDPLLKQKRFEIAAYADSQPIDTNVTPSGRAKNRRVEILLDYSKEESIRERDEREFRQLRAEMDLEELE